jgi:exopolysaccharide biosynthesis polyprenyl glycosylphosphotransferase
MFEKKSDQLFRVVSSADLALTVLSYLAAFWLRNLAFPGEDTDFLYHLYLLPLIIAMWSFFLSFFGAYANPRSFSRLRYVFCIFQAVGTGGALLISLLFFLKIQYISRMVVLTFIGLDIVALSAVRLFVISYFRRSLQRGENHLKVLILGSGNRAMLLAKSLRENTAWGIDIIGHVDVDRSLVGRPVDGSKVIGTIDDIGAILKSNVVDEVILAIPRTMLTNADAIVHACEEEGVKLRIMADVFDIEVARISLAQLGPLHLLTLEPVALDEGKLFVKRLFDLVLSVLVVPFLLPVIAVIALAIKLDSRGPVFFTQERVGLNKRRLRMLKFRSMFVGSEELMAQIEHLNEATGPIFKIKDDPRVTRVGRFIRKTSLDELPQIFNVIRGDMSFVGPRPMSVRDVDLFDRGIQRKRFSVKPGITCIWQISGRSNLPFEKWLELDLQYIENWSLGLDFMILLKTIPVVLRGTGAV